MTSASSRRCGSHDTNGLTDEVLALTQALVARPSVSPDDAGCQDLLIERLEGAGFAVERMRFGEVDNFWAEHPNPQRHAAAREPRLVLAGHTDVVPSGPAASWSSPPFEPSVRDGFLYGRGAADMKSSLAAMVVAAERFVADHPDHPGCLGLLVTSDEEADAVDGTVRVVQELVRRGVGIAYCIVGEPSSSARVGDVIRVGRRGSLGATAKVKGLQGHVAYPEQAVNPIHSAVAALKTLVNATWDEGDADFPPTSFQVSNVRAGTGAGNVIPGEFECAFNFRFNPTQTPDGLTAAVERAFESAGADTEFDWRLSGMPFITRGGKLIDAVRQAVADVVGLETRTSTSGGTSDGRFIAPTGAEVVEIGPVNETIHQVDERVALADLAPLTRIYESILGRVLLAT
ncbi:MAG: succinyl-diaminopimelate desuccinylase [Gammaproteobacteria bacterium]|nr:succinyl-diaminopimelate desuccinylase [Gammaproteobacteria bacterium]